MVSSLGLKNFLFLLVTVLLLSSGQILVKAGIQHGDSVQSGNIFMTVFRLLKIPLVLAGFLATASATFFYLTVLREVDLSIAYPFISLSYAFVLFASAVFLKEHISIFKCAGIASIILGLFLLTRQT